MIRQRKTSNLSKNYDTSIAYHTAKGSYFKIYHKGSEYAKSDGDLNKHMSINGKLIDKYLLSPKQKEILEENRKLIMSVIKKKVTGEPIHLEPKKKEEIKPLINFITLKFPFKVDFLKAEMDKVLRYELSLNSSFFRYGYKKKLYRKNDDFHKQAMNVYDLINTKLVSELEVTKKEFTFYKHIRKWLERVVALTLTENNHTRENELRVTEQFNKLTDYRIKHFPYKHTQLVNYDCGRFSKNVLNFAIDEFRKQMLHYQIKEFSDLSTMEDRVKDYNKEVDRRRDLYNQENNLKTIDNFGRKRIKNGKPIQPHELLSQTELRAKKLKKVNKNIMLLLTQMLEQGLSIDQIKIDLKLNKSTFYRYKADLELFGIFRNSVKVDREIETTTCFKEYYFKTDMDLYKAKLFVKPRHSRIDYADGYTNLGNEKLYQKIINN